MGIALLALATLIWMLLMGAQYLYNLVALLGLTVFFTYILLAPVNLMEKMIHQGLSWLFAVVKLSKFFEKMPVLVPRAFAILLVYLAFGLTVLVTSVRFLPVAFEQLYQFSNDFPTELHLGEEWVLNLPLTQSFFHQEAVALQSHQNESPNLIKPVIIGMKSVRISKTHLKLSPHEKQVIRERMFLTPGQIERFMQRHISHLLHNMLKIVSTTIAGFVYTITGFILVFYCLLDGKSLKERFVSMFPLYNQSKVNLFLLNFHDVMFGYTKGNVILGILTGIYWILVNSLFGIPYAFFLGTFFAVVQMIPVVGPWIGFLPWLLVAHLVSPFRLVLVLTLILGFQLVKDIWLSPKVLGHVLGIHPVIVILSLLVCSKIAGLLGILFAIPFASMINVGIRQMQHSGISAS